MELLGYMKPMKPAEGGRLAAGAREDQACFLAGVILLTISGGCQNQKMGG